MKPCSTVFLHPQRPSKTTSNNSSTDFPRNEFGRNIGRGERERRTSHPGYKCIFASSERFCTGRFQIRCRTPALLPCTLSTLSNFIDFEIESNQRIIAVNRKILGTYIQTNPQVEKSSELQYRRELSILNAAYSYSDPSNLKPLEPSGIPI